ncbi:MAG TPA: CdaR family protein, partial [Thermomicrobiales bacterium]|nr:CdaR family protein [Thermomicrobiales bacterium]
MTHLSNWISARVTSSDLIRLGSSLVLALLLWGWVTTREDPERTRSFSNVTVEVGELNGNLVVVSAPPNVLIRIKGPSSVIDDVEASEVAARLDLNEVDQPGSYSVPIVVSAPDGVWSRQSIPARVQIQVEESVAKQFPLTPLVTGDVSPNRRVGQIVPEVSEVTVRGPSSVVDRVGSVILPVMIGNNTRDFEGAFTPIARDKDGQPVTEVEISPNAVKATVPIEAAGKVVAVFANIVGTPAAGLAVLDQAVIPTTVLVDGDPTLLADLISIQTAPVDVTGATGNISQRVALDNLPEGVKVIEPDDGRVLVSVQIGARGVRQNLQGLRVEVINLGEGLQAEVVPDGVSVVVVASSEALVNLTAEDITIQVDATGLG